MDSCLMLGQSCFEAALLADTSFLALPLGILKVALALGFVIFVHELGHFAVAKWCGVQCDKFMVGFDIGGYKLSKKWGETEYGIGILPLGGYVKMLGQDDDPSKIAEQMAASEAAAEGADDSQTKEITGPGGEKYRVDRRSYLAKTVPQRMAIISAGVIMNLIFGYLFAVLAFGIGAPYTPCVIGSVTPGSPAYMSGLEVGDEIVELNGRRNPSFAHLIQTVMLGDQERGVECVVLKAESGDQQPLVLKPKKIGERKLLGVSNIPTTTLSSKQPTRPGSPAADAGFEGGDQIVEIDGRPIGSFRELQQTLVRRAGETLAVTVQRGDQRVNLEVAPREMRRLGVKLTMGPVTAVQPGGPADRAGVQQGDTITAVNGRSVGVADTGQPSWDPVLLPHELLREEPEVELTVRRGDEILELTAEQQEVATMGNAQLGSPESLPSLGLAYEIDATVASVVAGSDAAQKLQPGDKITSARIILPADSDAVVYDDALPMGEEAQNWPALASLVQGLPDGSEVQLNVKRQDEEVTVRLSPEPVSGLYTPHRGIILQELTRKREVDGLGGAMTLAWDRVKNDMGIVFTVLGKIGSDQVPLKSVAGPIGILSAAYHEAESGFAELLLFLTMLSVNLAVLNFLPIPVLDGGHMVFLAWEGVTGRPANEKVVLALHMVGFFLLISLMVFALGNDIRRFL